MKLRGEVRCQGAELGEYAAGRLPADRARAWEHHLISCRVCDRALADERALLAALAGAPSMPGGLHGALLALAATVEAPPVPKAPESVLRLTGGGSTLTLVAPSAPATHRSALRCTVVAAAAAGASAAAAWSLTVLVAPGIGPAVGSPASLATPSTRTSTVGTAPSSVLQAGWTRPSMSPIGLREAQSTP